jgi:hypothetical protein
MTAVPVVTEQLLAFWKEKGVALCAEAQADGVPCTALGRACETCAMAVAAMLAAHPTSPAVALRTDIPECGP